MIQATRRSVLSAAMLAAAATAAACSPKGGAKRSTGLSIPAANQPFVHAIPTDVNSMDPANVKGNSDQEFSHNVYDRLATGKWKPATAEGSLVYDGLELTPQLATSWDVDGATVTFHLRTDVKFYPTGNPMTAEDVRYSFERLTRIIGTGSFQAGVAGIYKPGQLKVVDDHTFQVTFTDPAGVPVLSPVSMANMRFQQFAIIDSVEVKKHVTPDDPWATNWLQKNLATTGPYYVDSRVANDQIVLKAVPNHWSGQQPYYETVIFKITGGADLVSLIKSGAVHHATDGLTGRQYKDLQAAGFQIRHGDIPNRMRISMAMDKGPTADKAVRQALMHSIPYDKIISTALAGFGTRDFSFANANDPLGLPLWKAYDYDPAKTKKLLADAGVQNLTVKFWYSSDLSYNEDIALLIKDSLAQAGVTLVPTPRPGLQLTTLARDRSMGKPSEMDGMYLTQGVFNWLDDPETITDNSAKSDSPSNWTRINIAEIDQLHRQFRKSTDVTARTNAYHRIQEILVDQAAVNPIVVLGRTVATPPGLEGVTFVWGPYQWFQYLKAAG
jgi:peptide/nickel transport system substrate-binding protein